MKKRHFSAAMKIYLTAIAVFVAGKITLDSARTDYAEQLSDHFVEVNWPDADEEFNARRKRATAVLLTQRLVLFELEIGELIRKSADKTKEDWKVIDNLHTLILHKYRALQAEWDRLDQIRQDASKDAEILYGRLEEAGHIDHAFLAAANAARKSEGLSERDGRTLDALIHRIETKLASG